MRQSFVSLGRSGRVKATWLHLGDYRRSAGRQHGSACNSVQGATATVASPAILAMWNLQRTESKACCWVRIPPSPPTPSLSLSRWRVGRAYRASRDSLSARRDLARIPPSPPTFARACERDTSYGWQATRRLSTVARLVRRSAKREGEARRWTSSICEIAQGTVTLRSPALMSELRVVNQPSRVP